MELNGKKPASPAVIMELLSREYGWTPDEIRAMRADDVEQYLSIITEREHIKTKKHGK